MFLNSKVSKRKFELLGEQMYELLAALFEIICFLFNVNNCHSIG